MDKAAGKAKEFNRVKYLEKDIKASEKTIRQAEKDLKAILESRRKFKAGLSNADQAKYNERFSDLGIDTNKEWPSFGDIKKAIETQRKKDLDDAQIKKMDESIAGEIKLSTEDYS